MAELSDSDIGLSDNDIGLAPTQQQAPSRAGGGLSDADIGLSDADIGINSPQAEGPLKTAGREAAHAVVPGAAGFVTGMGGGALAGSVAGPIGALGGAIVGGIGGAYLAGKAQDAVLDATGNNDSAQRQVNAEANPKSAWLGETAPALAFMRPDRAAPVVARVLSGGLMLGVEAGQEIYNDGTLSPGKLAASAAAGALLPTPNRAGRALEGIGASAASKISSAASKVRTPANDEVDRANQQPVVQSGASTEQVAPAEDLKTVGNSQSSPSGSERDYTKGAAPASPGPDTLTQGGISPDVMTALRDSLQKNRVDTAERGTLPGPEDPNNIDQSLKEAPIATGFPAQDTPTTSQQRAPKPKTVPDAQPVKQEGDQALTDADIGVPSKTGLAELGHNLASGLGDSLREHLWQRAQDGKLNENDSGQPTALLQGAKMARERGGLQTFDEFKKFADEQSKLDRGDSFQTDMHDLVQRYAPANPELHAAIERENEKVAQPTAAQAEAGNFQKGHPGRVYGREFSIETPKGGVREDAKNDPPLWRKENYPTTYGELLGTKGADGERMDLHYVGTGDRHFVIDQRDPATGKFDEHKIMGYAKDPIDALEHYHQGFDDGSGPDRVLSIKEASEPELRDWLARPGKKSSPFDAAAAEGAPVGPTGGEKPPPKVVTAAVTKMRADGVSEDAINQYLARPVGEQLAAGQAYLRDFKSTGNVARPDRLRAPAAKVEGLAVSAKDKASLEGKNNNIKALNDAFEATKPADGESKQDTIERARKFMEQAKAADFRMKGANKAYRPVVDHAPTTYERAAKKLLNAKNPSDEAVEKFRGQEELLRNGSVTDARATDRIESDIGLSRRSGDEAVANAEAASAPHSDVEDRAIENVSLERAAATVKELDNYFRGGVDREELSEKTLSTLKAMPGDIRKAAFDAADEGASSANATKVKDWLEHHFGEFDVPHEEAETMVKPEPVSGADDVKRLEKATEHVDITTPEGIEKFQSDTARLADNLIKTADRKAPVSASEGKASEGKSLGGVPQGDPRMKEMLAALERANAKNKKDNPANVRDEELGRFSPEPKGLKDLVKMFGKDENGSLNYKKIHQDYMSKARPQLMKFAQYMKQIGGMRVRRSDFRADARLKQLVSHMSRELARVAEILDGKYAQWAALPEEHQMDFMDLLERQAGQAGPVSTARFEHDLRQMGVPAKDAAWMAQDAPIWRALMDKVFLDDKAHGSEEDYVRGYVSHIFEQADKAAKLILGRLKPLGATWYQKERTFDSIAAARKAGFKLKYTNPIDILNARLNASINSNALVDAARGLQKDGLAVPVEEAARYHKRMWKYQVKLPDGKEWLIAPDTVPFWQNAVESAGLQGNKGLLGSVYRNWMRGKTFLMPIQLGLSLFHFGHILSINAADHLDSAFNNWRAGDSAKTAYGEAMRKMGRDLFAFPLDKLPGLHSTSVGRRSSSYEGRRIMDIWSKPEDQLTPDEKMIGQMFEEAGTSPYQPHQDVIGAKRSFIDALNTWKKNPTGIGANLKMIVPSIAHGVEKSQEWLFKDYIPGLKNAALARRMFDAVRHDPSLATNNVRRVQVFQELARSNDDRYGEMFYKGLFWNKALKDASLGSFVSLGWNLGQWRQLGGAVTQGTRALQRFAFGDKRTPLEKARQAASNKISFVGHYVAMTMLATGALSWALSGKFPTGLDYIYSRNGDDNDDGTPARLSNPFNTREAVMLKAHIDEKNSVLGGLATMLWNKTVLQPVAELLSNRDFYGDHLWDSNAGPVKALLQGADATVGRLFNPISITGGARSYEQGGGKKGVALALGGFGPAPKYAEEDSLERRITHLYREQSLPSVRPYEYGPKTGLGHGAVQSSIRLAAGDKTTAEARSVFRQQANHAKVTGDDEARGEAIHNLAQQGHLSARSIKQMQQGDVYTYRFARLPEATQLALGRQMSDADFNRYVRNNHLAGIKKETRATLNHERSSN